MDRKRQAILAIELSNPSAAATGGTGDRVAPALALGRIETSATGTRRVVTLGVEPVGAASVDVARGHDADLMPAMDRLMRRAGLQPRDLARIAVSAGPGGFTGLRISVAAAKLIAEATGAECVAIPSAEVVARRARATPPFAVVLASKGASAHVTRFAPDGTNDGGRLTDGSWFETPAAEGITALIADRFLPEGFARTAQRLGVAIERPVFDVLACLELSLDSQPTDPVRLAPVYAREPEAVLKWRELKAQGRK